MIIVTNQHSKIPPESTPKEQGKNALSASDGIWWEPAAKELVENRGADFGMELRREAIKIARNEKLGVVSVVHVEDAHQRLLAQRKGAWLTKFAGTIGGACVGCALGLIIPAVQAQQTPSMVSYVCSSALIAVGVALAIYHALNSK